MMRFLPFLFLAFASLFADPWGKDADLVPQTVVFEEPQKCRTPIFGSIAEAGIWFHQNIISPADGPRSNYRPSSSQYALDAIRKYGFFYGFLLGCDRLMRENPDPWFYPRTYDEMGNHIKLNPVP